MKKTISIVTLLSILLLCFTFPAYASSVEIISMPNKTTLYQGIDWAYNKEGKILLINGDIKLDGTILSYGSKNVAYKVEKSGPNMSAQCADSSWKKGNNKVKIYCDDFPSNVFATATVNFSCAKSIKIVRAPDKVNLVMGRDWNLGILDDVELTELDITGAQLKVFYDDNSTTTVRYPNNKQIGWSVGKSVDKIMPGEATIYLTFAGLEAPFTVNFVKEMVYSRGDVNKDEKITSTDALLVLQHTTGSVTLDSDQTELADLNSDGKINSVDALKILQIIVGA